MSVPYKNPISSVQVSTPQSVSRTSVFGTNFSILNVGGYMEVYNLSDLSLTLTASTYPSLIQLSANTIPIRFTKGDNTFISPDYLTLNSDNISSGRRRLGMLVYVHETDKVYQYVIPNYDTLWNNLSGLTGFSSVTYSDYTTVVNNRSSAGQTFISGWTSSNIEGVSGYTNTNSNWRIFQSGSSGTTVSGFYLPLSGGTVFGPTIFTSGVTANTISATTYLNLPSISGLYLPLSGGTVYGPTIFTSGVTANTLNVLGLTQTSGITSTGGITFKQVTINSSYTATTSDYMIDVTGGTFNVTLPSAVGIQGRLLVVKNNGGGAVTVQPVLGQNIDDKPFVILGETNTIQLASNGLNWVAISYNISTVNSSTGVFEFTGLSIASTTTFNVAPVKGWIVDDTTNPLSPQLYYVAYSGGVHTAIYVNTSTETWVYLTSGGTISQSSIELTDQQRRQNIFLGKLGHANKTNIINAFSQPDFVLSPLAQLRDMFVPINLINGGIYASPNGVNLRFNTSAGYLYGLGINFATSTLNPNSLSVSGTSPCTFQYRTQTGGTASNTTFIDPTKYDVGGVVTTITGTKATNQRIYLVQNGVFRVQYGQTEYNQLTAAIEGIGTEQFTTFSNFTNNGILIGILSVLSTATDLTDTSKARFFFASKFGETVGSAGGVSTTNLQQAYNNSIQPEITTNTTLGAVTIKNGTGNADNITNLLESQNSSGTVTSFIRADGLFSGNSLNLSSSASTINLNNPNRQQIRFFSGGTGAPTYNTYSAGVKIILSDNIDSISSGYAIGVDAGSLWYGADLAGNGHNWYGGTKQLMSLFSSSGLELVGLGGPTTVAMTISGTSSLGSKGGVGYMDFLRVTNNWSAATNTNKWFRTNITGGLEILRSDYNATILTISDGGIMAVGGGNVATTSSSDGQTNYLSFGNNNTQIYDDGNTHIHSRGANQSMWINTNNGQINIGVQSPVAGGGIASAIAFGTGTVNGYLSINTGRTITTAANYGYLTTGGAGTYGGGSQSVVISLYANSRIWGQEIDAFSDERMKDIEGNITLEDGLKLVNNLKPIKYRWKKGDDKGIKAGYSAQQVIKSGFDHLVSIIPNEGLEETIDKDGFMSPKDTQFSMNYDQVTPYHGVVIKHLLEQIELLKEEIRELKNK